MSNTGIELELTPQEIHTNLKVNNVYKITIDLSFGKINLLICE